MIHNNQNELCGPYFYYALLSLWLQLCAIVYVSLGLVTEWDGTDTLWTIAKETAAMNMILAIATFCFATMVAYREVTTTTAIRRDFYLGEHSIMALFDLVSNGILPVLVAILSFCVVYVLLHGLSFVEYY